jgi:import inner membrane translocase subunit TIM16
VRGQWRRTLPKPNFFFFFADAQAGQAAEGSAVGRSSSNPLTLRHKMGLDEALNILNVKAAAEKPLEETALQEMLKNYEHLFKVNGKTSHYLQSKVVRAKARIEAERGSAPVTPAAPEASSSAPGPPPPTL